MFAVMPIRGRAVTSLENVKRVNGITSDEQLDAALKQDNLTRAQLRSNWERVAITWRVLGTEGLALD